LLSRSLAISAYATTNTVIATTDIGLLLGAGN
jgi:hypothetical protein